MQEAGGTGGREHSRLAENGKLRLGWSMPGLCEEQQRDQCGCRLVSEGKREERRW